MSTLPTRLHRAAAAAILAVLFAGCSANGFDSETEALNKQMLQLHEAGRYREAIAIAQNIVAQVERTHQGDDRPLGLALSNLGELLSEQGRYAEAEPVLKRSLAVRERVGGPESLDVSVSLGNLGAVYKAQGRYAEAEPVFKRALEIKEKAENLDDPDVALALNNLAIVYGEEGRHREAEPLLKRALAIKEKAEGAGSIDVALGLNNLAGNYQRQQRYAEAEPLFKRGLAIREKVQGPEHPAIAVILDNLATLYMIQNRYAEAEPLYRRALAIDEKALGPDHPDTTLRANNLAVLYSLQHRYAEAEPLYRHTLANDEKTLGPEHPNTAVALANLAAIARDRGRNTEALGYIRRVVAILGARSAVGAALPGGETNNERHEYRADFLGHVALLFAVTPPGYLDESFRTAQLLNNSSTAQAVAGMAARFAAGTDALAATVRERQDLARQRDGLDGALVAAAAKLPADRNAAAEAELRRRLGEISGQLAALDARIARDFPQYAELSNPKPLELKAVEALLAPDEAMLVYQFGPESGWLWALRRDRAALYKLDIGSVALAAEVTKLRERLDPARNPNLAPFDVRRAFALYQKIVAPAAPLLAGAHGVFVVPDGALESLPIGVLPTRAPAANPEHPADHRTVAWFAREYASTVLPSVGSLRALRIFTARGHAPAPFVGIGNPVLGGSAEGVRGVRLASLFRGGMADVDAVRQLSPLPETANELRAVARDLGAGAGDLYLAERATEPMLRQAGLEHYRVVEFATHGLMSGELQGLAEPALVLTPPKQATPDNDGLLTASKVATLKFDADWVVLSACNTAAPDGSPDAGGLSGLAKAFFYAGARSLLVSHWGVASEATVKLVTGAFDELKRNPSIGRAEALRRAEMAMLDPSNPPVFAHPLIWAPFVLAGEGGAGR